MSTTAPKIPRSPDDVSAAINAFGEKIEEATWAPYDPAVPAGSRKTLTGSKIVLSGEYTRMQDMFRKLREERGIGRGEVSGATGSAPGGPSRASDALNVFYDLA